MGLLGLLGIIASRDGRRVDTSEAHAGGATPPHFGAASRSGGRGHSPLVSYEVVIVCVVDEMLSSISMLGESRRDRRIVVKPSVRSPATEPKEDKEYECSRSKPHDDEDTSDC